MIKIIGTTHLTPSNEIIKYIEEFRPDIIGVELCETRFKVFTNQINNSNSVKDDSILGKITEETKKKAEENNLDYASDMKTALFYAINNNIKLILLDKDINEIRKEMESIPINEQIYLSNELIKYKTDNLQREVDENEVIESMKLNIPITYKILVEERNNFIAKQIKFWDENYPEKSILIFLGKGHVKEVEKLI